jgi:predicted ATPase
MRRLPTGTVTFLFTDIEGSTKLLDELGDRYADVLAEHHRLMRRSFEPRGGVEVDTAGDAFFVAFERASDAVAAAGAAQEALAATGLRVRMGIHTGEPILDETGYVAMDVHTAARVMSAGHGGQVLISERTHSLLDGSFVLTDLGLHRLKDLTDPQRLWQLGAEEFPPLKTLYQTNLPVQPTPLVGRERELAEILELIRRERLVTLTGAGGSGKTRLALQAAAELADDFRDGVWWVSLAALRDPALVEPTVAHAVGATEDLVEQMRQKQTLVLLDNFEQVVDAAPAFARLLEAAPDVRLLVTSRARLAIAAEHEYLVPTLEQSEAVALFTTRARQLRQDFEPDAAVEEICRRLDGLPLAIELAAARIKILTPERILQRLGAGLDLLTSVSRDVPERQRTLRATIQWSYELLEDDERRLFANLAVFSGSFDVTSAEDVCGAELDTLAALADKSLLRRTEDGRPFMLETIREYALEQLVESGDTEAASLRHAEHFLRVAEALEPQLRGPQESAARDQLRAEVPNIRAALETAITANDPETALRLAGALHPFWYLNGDFTEGRRWAEQALALGGTDAQREKALGAAGEFSLLQGALVDARQCLEERLEICRRLGDPVRLAVAYTLLGHLAGLEHDYRRALEFYEQALALEEGAVAQTSVWQSHASALNNIGFSLLSLGRLEEAEMRLLAALKAAKDEKTSFVQGAILNNLGRVALARRDRRSLRDFVTQTLYLPHGVPNLHLLWESLELLARLGCLEARPADAARAIGGAERLREVIGVGADVEEVPDAEWLTEAREAIGPATWNAEFARGHASVEEDPLAFALACLSGTQRPSGTPP